MKITKKSIVIGIIIVGVLGTGYYFVTSQGTRNESIQIVHPKSIVKSIVYKTFDGHSLYDQNQRQAPLVTVGTTTVWQADIDLANKSLINQNKLFEFQDFNGDSDKYKDMAISPNGRFLVYSVPNRIDNLNDGSVSKNINALMLYDFNTENKKELINGVAKESRPQWSQESDIVFYDKLTVVEKRNNYYTEYCLASINISNDKMSCLLNFEMAAGDPNSFSINLPQQAFSHDTLYYSKTFSNKTELWKFDGIHNIQIPFTPPQNFSGSFVVDWKTDTVIPQLQQDLQLREVILSESPDKQYEIVSLLKDGSQSLLDVSSNSSIPLPLNAQFVGWR